MTECRRGPLPPQFDYAAYVAEVKAKLLDVWREEERIRAEREERERVKLEQSDLLRRLVVVSSSRGGVAAGFDGSHHRPSYWEWDMTTPNTMLFRTGKRCWLR